MSIINVKSKYQIVIPAKVRKAAGIEVGDFLEAGFEKGKITLTPQAVIAQGYS
jgi:AbrB family looped-hinge helix DNA binding protein